MSIVEYIDGEIAYWRFRDSRDGVDATHVIAALQRLRKHVAGRYLD